MSNGKAPSCGADRPGGLEPARVVDLAGLVQYADRSVVSRTLAETTSVTITLFAFDRGQKLSEHSTPFDALVQVLDGEGEFTIAGTADRVAAGQAVLMPAHVPHAVNAVRPFKMLLTMYRGAAACGGCPK